MNFERTLRTDQGLARLHKFELRRRRSLIAAQGWSAATTLGLDHQNSHKP